MAGVGDGGGVLVPGEQQIRAARFHQQRQPRSLRLRGGGLVRARHVAGINKQHDQYGHGGGYAAEHQHELSATFGLGRNSAAQCPQDGLFGSGLGGGGGVQFDGRNILNNRGGRFDDNGGGRFDVLGGRLRFGGSRASGRRGFHFGDRRLGGRGGRLGFRRLPVNRRRRGRLRIGGRRGRAGIATKADGHDLRADAGLGGGGGGGPGPSPDPI